MAIEYDPFFNFEGFMGKDFREFTLNFNLLYFLLELAYFSKESLFYL